ncbi:hypothetical protein BBD42_27000 [Paenibacillus sp. BIHB 4019]|uniref:ATP-dependent Clp protease proteolytic subunit n=1 Tax=Paenibacillus sp. BIHB 4019 TaxID=1870819 RepID=A0A1B2DPV0_9BACL|nr:head maturation protease, ClpP-related [Paenibacillus sp. BIHB 4019]ANY69732.1 hypothetical protein BBD42_27000 [Paenibacillus sp. BIHB 4019]
MGNKFWTVQAAANKSAELVLYGPISTTSWYGDEVTPKKLVADLKALGNVSKLTVRINSSGGDVFAGIAIYTVLKTFKAKVITRVDGLAASAASIIAMAGDEILMPTGSMMMIHNPWTTVVGESKDLRQTANLLDNIRESLINIYVEKTGKSRSVIGKQMDDETWLGADDALKQGYATAVTSERIAASMDKGSASFNGKVFDLSMYKQAPAAAAVALPHSPAPSPEYSAAKTEAFRIAALEGIRSADNGHIIDAAIMDGRTAGDVSMEIVRGWAQKNDQAEEDASVARMAAYANELIEKKHGPQRRSVHDEHAEGISAEINRLQGRPNQTASGNSSADVVAEINSIRSGMWRYRNDEPFVSTGDETADFMILEAYKIQAKRER